jgi:signal transduction histidine kinase
LKRSLGLHIFLRLLLCAALVIVINRVIAQYMLTDQITKQVFVDMQDSLAACQSLRLSEIEFNNCIARTHHGELTGALATQYTLCSDGKAIRADTPIEFCQALLSTSTPWKATANSQFEYMQAQFESTEWIAVRLSKDARGPQLALRTENINNFVMQMWQWRDATLIYVVPAVLLLLVFMALYMTRFVIGVLNQLKKTLSMLNVSNIDTRVQIAPHFRELEPLASVFEQMQVRLEKSLDQRQRFVSDASHELRTPLSILRGQAQRLIDESQPGSVQQSQLRSIADEVERLIDIVNKLLLLSQADSKELYSQMMPIDMSSFLTGFVHDVRSLESDAHIQSTIEPNLWINADETLIAQLTENLFSNALKYNIAGGWVRATLVRREDKIEFRLENTTGQLRPELQEQAFERFYRGDKSRSRQSGGLGLGLSICLEIARVHQGTLEIEITHAGTFVIRFNAPLART